MVRATDSFATIARFVVVVPAAAIVFVAVRGVGPSSLDLALFSVFYVVTMLGITAGYHRHFSHRAFRAHPAVRWMLAIAGAMAIQGPIAWWTAHHRRHHAHADRHGDPHSPTTHGTGLRGLWHAHVGWMLRPAPAERRKYASDLLDDALVAKADKLYLAWIALSLGLPFALGWLMGGDLAHGLSGLLWGGLIRVFATQHATWAINSIGHTMGTRPLPARDKSVNNFFLALATLGEGWHNNHHARPRSAKSGFGWWQVDPTWRVIHLLCAVGLVSHVRES